ncbi:Glu/Leu/Phe/Val family dehydrogenase [Nitrospina watsonii]|uniref:Glutamate dehydrogenase n=1 Tax=Nitrospina watsonii TaxID=1323948 RepID=A0ABN8VVM2_9BACT|nr:Glu/Leu/Phe/Val dehydrogenase [Nitrospina watsonii]CAI2717276.1 glutamate dehydrogenase [Nitrospina watsonii]
MSAQYVDSFADDLGPVKILHIYEPKTQLRAIVVVDNLAMGPAIGGCRMATDVSTREVFRLARAMTLKNALNDLPYGGGKSAIIGDAGSDQKEAWVREFARSIRHLEEYIPGPDMGTDEQSMAWVQEEIGRAVGLPTALGGLPLDELGATGFGVAVAADAASEWMQMPLPDARVVIQGFGNVGRAAARFMLERGARIVAVSDSEATLHDASGLDIPALMQHVGRGEKLAAAKQGQVLQRDAALGIDCDIFIPAARPDVFTEANQHLLKATLVLEGANIPITHEAARVLHERGIVVIPDIIANSGGVICAAAEFGGRTREEAFDAIRKTVYRNTTRLLKRVRERKQFPHDAAMKMAREPLLKKMGLYANT